MMPTFDIVPTVSVGTPRVTLRVTHRRSGAVCIPTRSVGTIKYGFPIYDQPGLRRKAAPSGLTTHNEQNQ